MSAVGGVSATTMGATLVAGPTPYWVAMLVQYVEDPTTLVKVPMSAVRSSAVNTMGTMRGLASVGPPAVRTCGIAGRGAG